MDWTRCIEISEEARRLCLSEDETLVILDVFACKCRSFLLACVSLLFMITSCFCVPL